MFWQAAAPVTTVRKPLFGMQIQSASSLEADEHCDEIRLIAVSALIP